LLNKTFKEIIVPILACLFGILLGFWILYIAVQNGVPSDVTILMNGVLK
jgi:hypothetical protein